MMVSLCKEYYQFLLAQGVLLGISMALVTWPMLALVGQYIKRKRAAAMGIVIAGSSLGGVVWPIAIDRLLQNPRIGFPWTMRIVGFIMLPCLLFSCVAARPPDKPGNNFMEQGTGHKSVAVKTEKEDIKPDHKTAALALFKQPSLQLLCLAMFITYFGMFSPFFYTTSYAVHEGFSENLSFYTVSIINGASFFGRILPGILADKYGKFNCCIVASLSSGIAALCWTQVTSVPGLVIWSAAYGFSSGVSCFRLTRINSRF
jgi:MFS family permease